MNDDTDKEEITEEEKKKLISDYTKHCEATRKWIAENE